MSLLPDYFVVHVLGAPLPYPLVDALREIEVECAVNRAASFRLTFTLSRTMWGDLDALALPLFWPLVPIQVRVAFGFGVPQCLINGFVQDVQLRMGNIPGQSVLEVTGSDRLGTLMAVMPQPLPWGPASPDLIARALFSKYGAVPAFVSPAPPTRDGVREATVQRVNDARFVFELAARIGYQAYIQPEAVSGSDSGHFHPPVPPPATQGTLSIDFGMATNLRRFELSYPMLKPAGLAGVVSDPITRVLVPVVVPAAAEPPMGLEPALTRILPPSIERETHTLDAANAAEALLHGAARATDLARAIRATGDVDAGKFGRILMVGLPVAVRGAGREHSGYYSIETVTHHISRDGYTQTFEAMRNAVGLTGAEIMVDPLAAAA